MSNSISVIGNLTSDAETRVAGSTTVTGFNIANNVGFGDKKSTLFFFCSLWGKQGESLSQYLKKGTKVFVSGELSQREYNDKIYLQIEVKNFEFAGSPSYSGSREEQPPLPSGDTGSDVPF